MAPLVLSNYILTLEHLFRKLQKPLSKLFGYLNPHKHLKIFLADTHGQARGILK
jgi:hypothetical protein